MMNMIKPRLDADPMDSKAARFAERMTKVPRRTIRCDIYGTMSVVLDERHAANIIRKVVPCATQAEVYAAMSILAERV